MTGIQKLFGTACHDLGFTMLYARISCLVFIPSQGVYFGPNSNSQKTKSVLMLLTLTYAHMWHFRPAKQGLRISFNWEGTAVLKKQSSILFHFRKKCQADFNLSGDWHSSVFCSRYAVSREDDLREQLCVYIQDLNNISINLSKLRLSIFGLDSMSLVLFKFLIVTCEEEVLKLWLN
jgi:hypothetical protein